MFHYLIILLDDTSTSFCHQNNPYIKRNLIPINILREAFMFALKANMNIQLVYPEYELPDEYKEAIFEVDHSSIVPSELTFDADVVVANSVNALIDNTKANVIVRDSFKNIVSSVDVIKAMLVKTGSISICINDIPEVSNSELLYYKVFLEKLKSFIASSFINGKPLQLTNITNRLTLAKMNNCNAGWRAITLAPNGKFYICPSFFYNNKNDNVGDLIKGVDIQNQYLFDIKHAPICSLCDSYQCKRCIWLNKLLTFEVNTPSHQQCVLAHYERNASMELLAKIREHGEFLKGISIPSVKYLDPIEIINK